MKYNDCKKILLDDVMNFNYIDNFKSDDPQIPEYKNIELIVHPTCNLGCTYCYIHRFGDKLYPKEIRNTDNILKNTEAVMDWIIENNYKINTLDIFSGELFAQKVGYDFLDIILDKLTKAPYEAVRNIVIPTNFTFILDEELTKRVENYVYAFKKLGIRFHLSASFDGALLDNSNRPIKSNSLIRGNKIRDDDYYNRCFQFIKKHSFGLHPMIYSNKIELWKDNFLWFQEKMEKYGIHWTRLFLLQVRDYNWTDEQCNELRKFVKWLYKWTFNKCKKDKQIFYDTLMDTKGFHLLTTPLGKVSRGLTCAIQSELSIRMADLMLYPCHRLMYSGFEYGKMIKDENNKIIDIEPGNVELFAGIQSADYKTFPYCQTCELKNLCCGGCLGSQYETNGDMFLPIPTVCNMQHNLVFGLVEAALETDTMDVIKAASNKENYLALKHIADTMKNKRRKGEQTMSRYEYEYEEVISNIKKYINKKALITKRQPFNFKKQTFNYIMECFEKVSIDDKFKVSLTNEMFNQINSIISYFIDEITLFEVDEELKTYAASWANLVGNFVDIIHESEKDYIDTLNRKSVVIYRLLDTTETLNNLVTLSKSLILYHGRVTTMQTKSYNICDVYMNNIKKNLEKGNDENESTI